MAPPKVTEEYLNNLKNRYVAWNRQNEAVNELVWKDFDTIITRFQEKAYAEGRYEAYSWLVSLEKKLKARADELKVELSIANGRT